MYACACACTCVCVCARERVRACVCVCVLANLLLPLPLPHVCECVFSCYLLDMVQNQGPPEERPAQSHLGDYLNGAVQRAAEQGATVASSAPGPDLASHDLGAPAVLGSEGSLQVTSKTKKKGKKGSTRKIGQGACSSFPHAVEACDSRRVYKNLARPRGNRRRARVEM